MSWPTNYPLLISFVIGALTISFTNFMITDEEYLYRKLPVRKFNRIEQLLIGCGAIFCFYWFVAEPDWMWFDLAFGMIALVRGINAMIRKEYWFHHSRRYYKNHSNGVTDPARALMLGRTQVIVALIFLSVRIFLTIQFDFLLT